MKTKNLSIKEQEWIKQMSTTRQEANILFIVMFVGGICVFLSIYLTVNDQWVRFLTSYASTICVIAIAALVVIHRESLKFIKIIDQLK